MFWKKKKPFAKLQLGVDVKRCSECTAPPRRCSVDDKPAIFHRWTYETQRAALVEYPDGSVGLVKPELVQFLDRGDEPMG